jgi:outer membrane protein assembly factor BamB
MIRALVALTLLAACDHTHPHLLPPDSQSGGSWPMQGGDRARSSWQSSETLLTPANVASPQFGLLWESPSLGTMFTSPLFADGLGLVIVGTSAGLVAAIDIEDGSVRWSTPVGDTVGATPLIDLATHRIYAASTGLVSALDLQSGAPQPGWPAAVPGFLANAPLALSPDGTLLYVPANGQLLGIDTRSGKAYGGAPLQTNVVGLTVNDDGRLFGTVAHSTTAHWSDALFEWNSTLDLIGTFSPYDACQLAAAGQDLGAPLLLPALDATTPHTVAFGGEDGSARLVERDKLPGRLDVRAGCGTDPAQDASLLPPSKMPIATVATRQPPALFRDGNGQTFLFFAGKSAMPPSLSRVKVAPFPSMPAYLNVDGGATQVTFAQPGPPLVSSNGGADAIVWVLDGNSALYAFDAPTLNLVWQSPAGVLHPAGGWNQPLVVKGKVLVATDRVQAFGLTQ